MLNQHEINLKQYQNKSLSYLNSTAHSEGVEFDKFIKEIDEYSNAVVLDLGCGGGHVAYNVARHADLVLLMIYLMKCSIQCQKLPMLENKNILYNKALLKICLY